MSEINPTEGLKQHRFSPSSDDLPANITPQPLPEGGSNLPGGGQKIEGAAMNQEAKTLVEKSMAKINSSMLSEQIKEFKQQQQQDWGTVSGG